MRLVESGVGGMGSWLLTLASALLFEELTLGALVRLIVAPRMRDDRRRKGDHKNGRPPR